MGGSLRVVGLRAGRAWLPRQSPCDSGDLSDAESSAMANYLQNIILHNQRTLRSDQHSEGGY
jgi:hypothetical protein